MEPDLALMQTEPHRALGHSVCLQPKRCLLQCISYWRPRSRCLLGEALFVADYPLILRTLCNFAAYGRLLNMPNESGNGTSSAVQSVKNEETRKFILETLMVMPMIV